MRKQKSQFSITPAEELDLQHQGSLGGDQVTGRYGRSTSQGSTSSESNISSFKQSSSEDFQSGRKPGKGADVAMTSSSPERRGEESPRLKQADVSEQEQGKASKKHHYK